MGFWPFGGGKRQRAAEPTKHVRERSLQSDPPSEKVNRLEKTGTDISGNTKTSTQQEPGEKSRRLSKSRLSGSQQQLPSQTEPIRRRSSRRLSQPVPPFSEKAIYQQNPASQSSLGPESFNVVRQSPRLYARKPENDSGFARRKSSKRKAEDYVREREVRMMSSSPIPIPRRPSSFYGSGPLQRETHDVPGPFSRKSTRPASQVSLPLPDTLQDVDEAPYQNSFKIGMFAALSPRPTIKYDANPKHSRGKQPQRPKAVSRPSIVEEEDADKKRIDDLADDLDAGGLRELMERDRRRRERKTKVDQARLQRKLERRAEREKEDEARKARTEEYVSASASRVHGLGLESSAKIESPAGPSRAQPDPFADPKSQPTSPVAIRNPFEDEKDLDTPQDAGSDAEKEPVIPVRSPLRKIQTDISKVDDMPISGTLSPPRSPAPRTVDRQSMSQASFLNREATTELNENASLTGAASDHSSQRLSSWTAFFRRGTRRKLSSSFQGRSTPSEFSNTSRESFARKQPPPVVAPRTFRRADSATPQRTMSKFREDLPEFPASPPDSRMQSPEATVPPLSSTFNQATTHGKKTEAVEIGGPPPTTATSRPIPAGSARLENQTAADFDANLGVKQELLLSQSLASVDSEASWLSGKPLNRRSGASQRLQPSRSSLTRPMPGAFDGATGMASPPESPAPVNGQEDPIATEAVKKDGTWHAGIGRQPTVIKQASRAKSKEGLLNEDSTASRKPSDTSTDDDDDDDESPGTAQDETEPAVALGRAKSVEYRGGHGRQISAGSARLLDIRRSSTHSTDLLARQASSASASRDKLAGNRSSIA